MTRVSQLRQVPPGSFHLVPPPISTVDGTLCPGCLKEQGDGKTGVPQPRSPMCPRRGLISVGAKICGTVPMAPLLSDVLKAHRRAQVERPGLCLATGLVFQSYRGTPRSTGSLKKTFVALGVHHDYGQSIGPQVLRRTFNTLLLAAQVDQITIRAMMGHTSAAMTQRYAGVRMDEKRAAVLNLFG